MLTVVGGGPIEGQQTPYFPPDFYNDFEREAYSLWHNPQPGWVIDTEGHLQEDVQFVTEGALPRTYIRREAVMSFVMSAIDTSVSTADTLWRLDMELVGTHAQRPDAAPYILRERHLNFHLPHCGASGITDVQGYNRIVYDDIYPDIDLWVYSGARGQKMMFVVGTHGDPANIEMLFTGQDELDVDVNGWLKLQMQNRWIGLPEAVAYQVDVNENIIPVSWTPNYVANNNSGIVTFDFDGFDRYKPLIFLIGPPPPQGGPPVTDGVCWTSYQGGDGIESVEDLKFKDTEGLFACGYTNSSFTTFPASVGLSLSAAPTVMTITKFGLDDQVDWVCRYGCSAGNQRALRLDFDPLGSSVFIGGYVAGSDLPMPISQPSGWHVQSTPTGSPTGIIAAFQRSDGHLFYATYFGGQSRVNSLKFDPLGNMFFCGTTGPILPAPTVASPPGATSYLFGGGAQDGFVARLNQSRKLDWTTCIGGTGYDWAWALDVAAGKVAVVGGSDLGSTVQTIPTDDGSIPYFPSTVYQQDFFTQEFTPGGHHVWGSYFGYNGGTALSANGWKGLAVDPTNGDIVVVGHLVNVNTMPITTNWPWYDDSFTNAEDGFIFRYDGSTKGVKYASLVSGIGGLTALQAIVIGSDGKQYICGTTDETGLEIQPSGDLYNTDNLLGPEDGLLLVLSAGNDLYYSTLFGGNGEAEDSESLHAIAVTPLGRMYFGGYTGSAYNENQDLFFPLSYEFGAWWDQDLVGDRDGVVGSICGGNTWTGNAEHLLTHPFCSYFEGTLRFPPNTTANGTLVVTDAAGRIVFSTVLVRGQNHCVLPDCSSGIYMATFSGSARLKFWKP